MVQADFATQDATAVAGLDYVAVFNTLVFVPGETTKTIGISIIGDTLNEPNEDFRVVLSNVVNANIVAAEATIVIVDDDAAP
jgi:hypothetical protein